MFILTLLINLSFKSISFYVIHFWRIGQYNYFLNPLYVIDKIPNPQQKVNLIINLIYAKFQDSSPYNTPVEIILVWNTRNQPKSI